MENKSKRNTVFWVIIIILLVAGLVYVFISGSWQKGANNLLDNSQLNNQNQEETVKQIENNTLNYYQNNNLREKGETCGENIGDCKAGLKCGYPCGIQGCQYVCMDIDELSKP